MATTDTTAPSTASSPGFAFGAALAQPTIAFIQSQIGASLPSQVASSITAQFQAGSGQGASSLQLPAAGASSAGAALGPAQAQSVIASIQSQIGASLPSQVASFITSQFATASNPAGLPAQPSNAAAALQSLAPDAGVADFFSALNAKPV